MTTPTPGEGGPARPRSPFHDLGGRLVSGIVLAGLALGLAYLGGVWFAALVTAICVLMAWEWGRIVRGVASDPAFFAHGLGVVVATVLATLGQSVFAGVTLAIFAIIVLAMTFGRHSLLSATGVLYVGVPAVALIVLRGDAGHGLAALLFILFVVVAVDIGAFVGGRSIGGPRLWPSISPNKTWSGLSCGVGAGVLTGLGFALVLGAPRWHVAAVAFFLGLTAQAGDLAESALKRRFGVKDASTLIPGHGGFLDRLDGVVAAAILAGLIGMALNIAAPARALLYGS